MSVVLPTYNGEAHLSAALESIAAQGDAELEAIAVDDGSTDGTLAILESFVGRLPLTVIRRGHAGNWVATTNLGLARARGKWICLLHQDDVWLSNRLRRLRQLADRHPEATLLLSATRFIDPAGRHLNRWRCPLPADVTLDPERIVPRLLVQNFISVPAPLFRREAALAVGGMDEGLWYTPDWDFWLKLAAAGKTVYVATPLVSLRVHPQSQTIVRSADADDFRHQLDSVIDRHLPAWETRKRWLRPVAELSVEVDVALAGVFHGQKPPPLRLVLRFLRLGPVSWVRYLRYSRVVERVQARLRSRQTATRIS